MDKLKEPINDVKIILVNKKSRLKQKCFMRECHQLIDQFGAIGHKCPRKPKLFI